MSSALSLLLFALPALAAAEGGRLGGGRALRGGRSGNGTSAQEAPVLVGSFASAGDDPCWIHKACDSTPGYSDIGSMGRGWYCSDGMPVDAGTQLDECHIHEDCQVGPKWDGGKWICADGNSGSGIFGQNDACFIHQNCQAGAAYSSDGTASMGNGWYCMDGQPVDANTQLDECHIHKSCECGASFKFNSWFCNC